MWTNQAWEGNPGPGKHLQKLPCGSWLPQTARHLPQMVLDNPFVTIGSFPQQILLLCLLSVRHLDGSWGYLELMSTGESDYRHIHPHISIHECMYLKPTSRWVLWRKLMGGSGGTGGWDGISCGKEDVTNSTGWSQVLKWSLFHLYSPFAQPSDEHTENI